jgi:hypothetical protein
MEEKKKTITKLNETKKTKHKIENGKIRRKRIDFS